MPSERRSTARTTGRRRRRDRGRAQAALEGLESAVGAEEHEEGWRGGKTRRGEAGGHGV